MRGRSATYFWSAWAVGLVLNLAVAAMLTGTSDVQFYGQYGATLAKFGVAEAYASSPIYNIPPLAAGFSALLAGQFGIGTLMFGFFFRLPGILAEAAFAVVLWRRYRPRALPAALLGLNPLSLAITGYHGNLDGLMAVFIGASLLAAMDGRVVASAVWLGLAANLKVSPILIGPAFFFWWLARGQGWRFAAICGAVVLAGWSPGLIACPGLFLQRVLGYGSTWGLWGISRVLYLVGDPSYRQIQYGAPAPGEHTLLAASTISAGLKFTLIGLASTLGWRRRLLGAEGLCATVAAVWLLFLLLAPGGATQYLIWPLIPLLLHRPRLAVVYAGVSIPTLAVYYAPLTNFLASVDPVRALGPSIPWMAGPDPWTWPGLALWAFVAGSVACLFPGWWKASGPHLGNNGFATSRN